MTFFVRRRRAVDRPVRSTALLLATLLMFGGGAVAGCSSDDKETSSVLDQVAPTKSDVATAAGIVFPPSTTDFRLVRISGDQIDVSFTIAATDVNEFASGSGIELTSGERTITHASPLWDVAVSGEVQGGSSTRDQIGRNAEVLVEGDTATVRLSINRG